MDIEGEDNQVVGDDTLGDDDDSVVKSSQDVDTTILFTKPITSLGDAVFGKKFRFVSIQAVLKIINIISVTVVHILKTFDIILTKKGLSYVILSYI